MPLQIHSNIGLTKLRQTIRVFRLFHTEEKHKSNGGEKINLHSIMTKLLKKIHAVKINIKMINYSKRQERKTGQA